MRNARARKWKSKYGEKMAKPDTKESASSTDDKEKNDSTDAKDDNAEKDDKADAAGAEAGGVRECARYQGRQEVTYLNV